MRKVVSFVIKSIALVLIVLTLVTFWTDITALTSRLFGGYTGPGIVVTTQISHELKELGMLTSMQYTDTGEFVSSIPAVIIGEAQRVTVPYEYQIDYGVNLEQASIQAVDDGLLSVSLPMAEIIHDALRVTGKVQVFDVLYPLTEARYQQILDEQTIIFRTAYEEDATYAQAAYEAAKDKVRALLESMLQAQGAAETWSVVFED